MKNFEYYAPHTLAEAISLLNARTGETKILAGGTDLMVQMKSGRVSPVAIVDVKNIPELNRLDGEENSGIFIGAAVPLSRVITFPPLIKGFGFLQEACSLIGSCQLKNRGTVGGNICNAAPSADSAAPLLCLETKAVAVGKQGERTIPLEDFFLGPGTTALAADEILIGVEIPVPPAPSGGCYMRHTTRRDMDIGIVGVASFLVKDQREDVCREARIALAAVAPTPIRVPQAENILKGKALTRKLVEEAAAKAAEAARPVSDVRASAEYRREIVSVLTRRTLEKAWEGRKVPV